MLKYARYPSISEIGACHETDIQSPGYGTKSEQTVNSLSNDVKLPTKTAPEEKKNTGCYVF
jgi:hypothetical protein